uniref:Uncharacterized protein n=1 Tax=viral metagenome TaxID=1070528 RepID=A0A6M3KDH4_9ZZZZ
MTKKKHEPNQIEEAIGERAKPKQKLSETDLQKVAQDVKKAVIAKVAKMENPGFPQTPSEIPDEPSPSEMMSLEELNRRTEARLQEEWPEEPTLNSDPEPITPKPKIPASKQDLQPVTETSSLELPPQRIEKIIPDDYKKQPTEDVELTALKKYIREDGFVLSTVAFHIVTLCAQPMVTPSTTTWDFVERAEIPAMVLALLNQPGYIEGIWPSLRIVMGSNKGNQAWCAGIATTIAFFDVIRTLPAIEELKNEKK